MNYLAHLYLSGEDDELKIGNFIADALRKKQWVHYPEGVVRGIKLHHSIDFFTDHHPIVETSKARMRKSQGKYAPVVVDILYDHFLSARFSTYSEVPIARFADNAYALMQGNMDLLPSPIQKMLPYMIRHNWLVAYGSKEGLQSVFNGMSRRARFQNNMHLAVRELFAAYALYAQEFETFFPLLQAHVAQVIREEH